jgi:methionyl-tRNA formyltransferase
LRKDEAVAPIHAWQPDVIIVAAFGQLLRPNVLELPPGGCINVHASLLPRWRGASPIQHAILAGDAQTGISLMRMDAGLDTGPVYVQETTDIGPHDTSAILHDRLASLGADMLRRFLDDILAERLLPVPQDDSLSTYAPIIRKEAGQLDWSRSCLELDRLVRAMTPWPGAHTWWQNEPLRITRARPIVLDHNEQTPGEVLRTTAGIIVRATDCGLLVEEVQAPGKRAMPAVDFANGHPDWVGSVMGKPDN